ncbi:MAG TPA: hypothetical protein VNN62_08000 [Methylomirabilota bacterium]|nr:hypothetical protein [Methylomirabilota bacterium]
MVKPAHPLAPHWMFLSQAPFYTPVFLPAPECQEPLLAMRVEEIEWFSQQFYQTVVRFTAWCGPQETWVIAFPFRIGVRQDVWVEGAPCLNPRNAADAELIRKFTRHERIHLWLLNYDLSDFVVTELAWPAAQHHHVARLLTEIDQTLLGEKLTSPFDPDFEAAKREFQSLYTVERLLHAP